MAAQDEHGALPEGVLFQVASTSRAGERTESRVVAAGGSLEIQSATGVFKPREADLAGVLAAHPELLEVGTGLTEISWRGGVDTDVILSAIHYADQDVTDSPAEAMRSLAQAGDAEVLTDAFLDARTLEDELLGAWQGGSEVELVPRWLLLNGSRAFLARWPVSSATGLIDTQGQGPAITGTLLEWNTSERSAVPAARAGKAVMGSCGPGLWAIDVRGDDGPGVSILPAKADREAAGFIASWLHETGRFLSFILEVYGAPELSEDESRLLDAARGGEGEWIDSMLDADREGDVVERLVELDPQTFFAVLSLKDSDSTRGRAVYGWLRLLLYSRDPSLSWLSVQAAMYGLAEPPDPALAANAEQERMADERREAGRALAADRGWAPPVDVPPAIVDAVRASEARIIELDAADRWIEQLRGDTSGSVVGEARALLGLGDSEGTAAAWRAYEARAAGAPQMERQLHDAYTLIQLLGDRRSEMARAVSLREEIALLTAGASDEGWPEAWSLRYFPAWKELHGTGPSARSWAAAGWHPRDVLTKGQLEIPWNAEIPDRVKAIDVPALPRPVVAEHPPPVIPRSPAAPRAEPRTCPRCGHFIPNDQEPGAYPGAWSPGRRVEICSPCGPEEALVGYRGADLSQESWPVEVDPRSR